MRRQRIVETRWVVCVACGHSERLVTRTRTEFISQCFVCGDTVSNPLVKQLTLPVERTGTGRVAVNEAIAQEA